jgi:hypothetical protein
MDMEIKRSGAEPSRKGPAEWFTGTVRIDPLFQPPDPARVNGAMVTFEPVARTAWRTHPLGQTLLIVSGVGWVQRDRPNVPCFDDARRTERGRVATSTDIAQPPGWARTILINSSEAEFSDHHGGI